MTWYEEILDSYYSFLRAKTVPKELDSGWIQLSTPFLGLFNDSIDLYMKSEGEKIILSDDGETLRNLSLCGFEITRSPKRKKLFDMILYNYGVRAENEELICFSDHKSFGQKKLDLLSAIREVCDLSTLAKHTVASIFQEDVENYLNKLDVVYTPHFISKGQTGLEFTFNFHIAFRESEIVMNAFNSVNNRNLAHFLFTWDDIKVARETQIKKTVKGIAFLNDNDKPVKGEYKEALLAKGADFILWSERNKPESIEKLGVAS